MGTGNVIRGAGNLVLGEGNQVNSLSPEQLQQMQAMKSRVAKEIMDRLH